MTLKLALGEQQPSSSHVMSLSRSGNGPILSKRGSSSSGGLARWRQSKQAGAAAAAHLAMGGGKWRTGEGLHQPAASPPAKLNLINLLQPRFGPQLARLTFVILPPTSCTPSAAAPDPRVPRQRLILSSRIPPFALERRRFPHHLDALAGSVIPPSPVASPRSTAKRPFVSCLPPTP